MVYRHAHNLIECLVCARSCAVACRNCGGPHCARHLVGPSCHNCAARLWRIERETRSAAGAAVGLIGLSLAVIALAAGFDGGTAFASFALLCVLPVAYLSLPAGIVRLLRPRMNRRRLPVTSTPLPKELPPSQPVPAATSSRRRRRRPITRLGKTPVVVGRGIVFR